LAIIEKAVGPDHPSVARSLYNLANLFFSEGRYADAEPLYQRSLKIVGAALGPDHPDLARSLAGLAALYKAQGRYASAEPLLTRSLAIREKILGPDHPDVAFSLSSLAGLYGLKGQYADAEPLYKRSLEIREKALGPDHPEVAASFNDLAALYVRGGRYADALPLVRSAALKGFAQRSTYLAVLTGAAETSIITNTEALDEGYQIIQQARSTAASKALNRLAVRFAVGNDELAQFVRKDQDLFLEVERLYKLIEEAVSKEPSRRNAANEQRIKDRLGAIFKQHHQIDTVLNERVPSYAALAEPKPLSVPETQQILTDDEALIVYDFGERSYAEVFTHSNARSFELKITATDLEVQIKDLRSSLEREELEAPNRSSLESEPAFVAEASYRLYQSHI
jgi:hypothetical protein